MVNKNVRMMSQKFILPKVGLFLANNPPSMKDELHCQIKML